MTIATINLIISDAEARAHVASRLWSKVEKTQNGCWPWKAKAKHMFGYGVLSTRGNKTVNAHALVWALTNGAIPDGAHILHKCDVPGCCNPEHLYCADNARNRQDMIERGRGRKGGHSPETIEKIKRNRALNPPKQTEAGRVARSKAAKARWQDPSWREKFAAKMSGESNHRFGKRPSEHQLQAVRENHRSKNGYRHTEETKAKMREAALRRYAR